MSWVLYSRLVHETDESFWEDRKNANARVCVCDCVRLCVRCRGQCVGTVSQSPSPLSPVVALHHVLWALQLQRENVKIAHLVPPFCFAGCKMRRREQGAGCGPRLPGLSPLSVWSPFCNQATAQLMARGLAPVKDKCTPYIPSKPLPGLPGCLNASNLPAGWGQSPKGFLGQDEWKKSFGVVCYNRKVNDRKMVSSKWMG